MAPLRRKPLPHPDQFETDDPSLFLFRADGTKHFFKSARGSRASVRGAQDVHQEIAFKKLSDGRLVEIVEDPKNPDRTLLAVWDGSDAKYVTKLKFHGQVLVPIPRRAGVFRHIVLPTGLVEMSSRDVFIATMRIIRVCIEMNDQDLFRVAAYSNSTWFSEWTKVAIYLSIVGPSRSGKTALLKVMNLICRHPVLVGDSTPAAMYHAYATTTPTFLIDESSSHIGQSSSSMWHLLRVGTEREQFMRSAYDYCPYGPKVIVSPELPDDLALRGRCIAITMTESNNAQLLDVSDPRVQELAAQLRNGLLFLRLKLNGTVRSGAIPGSENLRACDRDLLASLAAPFAGDQEMVECCHWIFSQCDLGDHDVLSVDYRMAISVLLALDHFIAAQRRSGKTASCGIYTGKLGELVNNELKLRGERIHLNAKKVGSILKSLGIRKGARNSGGIPIFFDLSNHKRIHALARIHGVDPVASPSLQFLPEGCDLCNETNNTGGKAEGENAPES